MAPTLSIAAKATLDGLLAEAIEENRIPGVFFAAATADNVLYSGSAGLKSFQDPAAGAVDADSVFWICSMTKLVVTVAIIQLIERDAIGYDTPVDTIIPELANPLVVDDPFANEYTYKPAQTKILVRHLLNHSSGLHYYPAHRKASPYDLGRAYNGVSYEEDHSPAKFFELIRNGLPGVPLAFEPGTSWAYGWNCDIVALIVERLTHQTIEEYCKEHIFGPVGMPSTTFLLTESAKKNLVNLAYRRVEDDQLEKWNGQLRLIEQDPEKIGIMLGGIGIYSNLPDYLSFLRHLLLAKDGRAKKPILSVPSVNALFTPSLPDDCADKIEQFTGWSDCNFGYGLCLANSDWQGGRRKGSGFWYGWAGTYYFMDPTTGVALVYGTQVVPTTDDEVVALWYALEHALYEGLMPAEGSSSIGY